VQLVTILVLVLRLRTRDRSVSAENVLAVIVFAMGVIARLIFGEDQARTDNRTVNKDREFDSSLKTYSGTHAMAVTAEV
jgi:hypothetical protein